MNYDDDSHFTKLIDHKEFHKYQCALERLI